MSDRPRSAVFHPASYAALAAIGFVGFAMAACGSSGSIESGDSGPASAGDAASGAENAGSSLHTDAGLDSSSPGIDAWTCLQQGSGIGCTSSKDCCDNSVCAAGLCVDLSPTTPSPTPDAGGSVGACGGEPCSGAEGCCEGFYCNGVGTGSVCELIASASCGTDEEQCTDDYQCCSGSICGGQACVPGTRRGAGGTPCAFDDQCVSSKCEPSGLCSPGACTNLGACTKASDCCASAPCVTGACTCVGQGGHCTQDSDCCWQECDTLNGTCE